MRCRNWTMAQRWREACIAILPPSYGACAMRRGLAITATLLFAASVVCGPSAADELIERLLNRIAATQDENTYTARESVVDRFYRDRRSRLAWTGSEQAEQ